MKIVFFVHRFWPSVGGVEKYIGELARALIELGHDVDVIAGAHVDDLKPRDTVDGIRIHRFPATRSPLRCRAWLWRHIALLTRADIINVSNTHMLEYLWRMLGPALPHRKLFLTRHGMACDHPVPASQRRRARRSLGMAQAVAHDGRFIEKWLGVNPDICPDQGLRPLAEELAPVREPPADSAVYIGRLEPDTSIIKYMETVEILNQEHQRKLRLDVYGDGSLLGELKRRAARGALPVKFRGKEPDAQRHISEACFALVDGRMAMQEAMARKRLVFASYADPLKFDYVATESFSPFLVLSADTQEMARQVVHYSDDRQARKALVDKAFGHVRALSWAHTASEYLGLWKKRIAAPSITLSLLQRVQLLWELERESRWGCKRPAPDPKPRFSPRVEPVLQGS